MAKSFVHLHCHSEYSLLESPLRVGSLVSTCQAHGMSSMGLTDNGVMFGAIDFYVAAKKSGLNPIIGCEMYLAKDMALKERGWDRLILLCKNYEGYKNLIKLVSLSHLDGFYYRPRIDMAALARHSAHLVAISPGMNGPVAYNIRSNEPETAERFARELKAIFADDFYLGIQRLDMAFEEAIIEESARLSEALGIPLVVTNDVYYGEADHAFLRNILNSIQTGKRLSDDPRIQFQSQEAYLKSPEEMWRLFADFPAALENTVAIADKCKIHIETDQVQLPHFECPDNLSNEAYLEILVKKGIEKKYGEWTKEIEERVRRELDIIIKMGFAPYFLIIYDFLDFCEREDIPVGPGRGSAAGSIVAYALNITKIDPLKYKLLFERFLNPERISMPDIDLDFCIRRRGEVIEYLVRKYGEERVAQIITFGTMASRGVVRDVGRALDVPLNEVDRIAKLIPSSPGQYTSIREALEQVPELKKLYDGSDEIKELLDTGSKLEGVSRHSSTHAAGVVISRDPLTTVVPLIKKEGQVTTQFAMVDIEKVGLLKLDILGLRNLTVMNDAVKLIKRTQGIDLNLDALDYSDEKTYDLLCSGNAIGIFQLESRGMRQLIKELQPRVFEDIIALLALYRPGPLGSGMVSEFISNKSGKTEVKYELDILEPILKDTYGMIVYQEQVMQIASVVGGFTLGQADMLRRAMGKKKKEDMDKMRLTFMEGAAAKGIAVEKASKIFDLCYKFAEYGFNKSHSAAYALISFQTAYLKAHFPVEYMAALLSSVLGLSDRTSIYIQECQSMGIRVLPPDVNESDTDFTITKEGIRFGLRAVKNVGEGAIESIIKERQGKPYTSLTDLCMRVELRQVNKRVVESLIKSGAMDCLGDRSKLLACYEQVLDQAQVAVRERNNGQTTMFSQFDVSLGLPMEESLEDFEMLTPQALLRMEKEMLGLYISGHPLDSYRKIMDSLSFSTDKLSLEDDSKSVELVGVLSGCRRVVTRTKKEMLIGTLADLKGEVTVLCFQQDDFEKWVGLFKDDNIVKVSGRIRVNQEEITLSVDQIDLLDHYQQQRQLNIDIDNIDDLSLFEQLRQVTRQNRGAMPIFFHIGGTVIQSHRKYWITDDSMCLSQIENLVGPGHVWISYAGSSQEVKEKEIAA